MPINIDENNKAFYPPCLKDDRQLHEDDEDCYDHDVAAKRKQQILEQEKKREGKNKKPNDHDGKLMFNNN